MSDRSVDFGFGSVKNVQRKHTGNNGSISTNDLTTQRSSDKNAPPKKTNFQLNFGSVSDGFKGGFDWEDDKGKAISDGTLDMQDVFDNALNGQYKSMLNSHSKGKGYINKEFKKLGENAWKIGSYIKSNDEMYQYKISQGPNRFKNQEEMDAWSSEYYAGLNKLRGEFYNSWVEAKTSVYVNEKGENRGTKQALYLTGDAKLQTKGKFKRASFLKTLGLGEPGQNIAVDDDTWEASFIGGSRGLAGQNIYATENAEGGYDQVEVNDRMDEKYMRDLLNPIIHNWVNKGVTFFNSGEDGIEKNTNQTNTMALIDDTVNFISKNGTGGESSKEMQKIATRMKKEMTGLEYKAKKTYIVKNLVNWDKMTSSLGFYGSQHVYNKHKEYFNKPKYYIGKTYDEKQAAMSKSNNQVASRLRIHKEYKLTQTSVRDEAYKRLTQDLDFELNEDTGVITASNTEGDRKAMVYKHLRNAGGGIRSRDQVLKSIRQEWGKTTYGQSVKFNPGYYEGREKGSVGYSGRDEYPGPRVYEKNMGYSWTQMVNAYNDVKHQYKVSFGKADMKNVSDYTTLVNGIGFNESDRIEHEIVDLNVDNIKTDEVNVILDMVNNKDWKMFSPDIYISDNPYDRTINKDDIKEASLGDDDGTYNDKGDWNPRMGKDDKPEGEDKDYYSYKSQYKYFKEFFKDADKKKLFNVQFSRESPLKGKSFYEFIQINENQEPVKVNGKVKRLSMYIDKKLADRYNESFAKSTSTSPSDWSFSIDGVWDMEHAQKDKAENLQIMNNDGDKYATGLFWDATVDNGEGQPKGAFSPRSLYIGPSDGVSIIDAEELVIKYLDNIKR
tara:strand:- start:504 stop:3008 length:2505 start_codon:yes stop_codon:yes gene_type:complete